VEKNTPFRVTISPNNGCKLKSIKTIMNGETRNERNYPNGSEASFTWSETYVTGDLVVIAIAEIEVSGGNLDQSQIGQAVADYLTENPVTGGLTKTEKDLILQLFRNAAYTSSGMNPAFTQLETLWSGSGEGGSDVHSHSYTSSITTAATCTTAGVKTYTCN
jgi:hypothetical protein